MFDKQHWKFPEFCIQKISKRIRNDLYIYIIIFTYCIVCIGIAWEYSAFALLSHSLYFEQWTKVFFFGMPALVISLQTLMVLRRFHRRRALALKRLFSADRMATLVSGLILLGALMLFQGSFTSIKNMLPLLRGGFGYDQFQAQTDAWLHLGVDPWLWIHSVLGFQWIRNLLEFNYNVLWFILCYGALFFVATSPRANAFRRQYIFLYIFVWVICGNLLAGLFLSAGPAFYGEIVGDHGRFAGLLAFLKDGATMHSATSFQAYLWGLHEAGRAGFGSGISAFPSVHVGLITLNALFLNRYSRRWGCLAFFYVAVVQLSSVYLGWHYAIDGYASIVVVTAAFMGVTTGSRFLTGRHFRQAGETPTVKAMPVA